MPQKKLFDEETAVISVRVPASKKKEYRTFVRKIIKIKYNKDKTK